MAHGHNRLTKYGIAGLAGIAILGWVREPERHSNAVSVADRATFQFQATPPEAASPEFSGQAVPAEPLRPGVVLPSVEERVSTPLEEPTTRRRAMSEAAPVQQQPERRVITRPSSGAPAATPPPASQPSVATDTSSRHDFPEDRSERPTIRRNPEPVQTARVEDRDDDYSSPQARPVVRARQQRSTKQSAMIIAGAAAAGAAIGGLSGGGKGAAIGAVTAGAGGYVYDRMTRNRGGSSNGASSLPSPDDANDHFTSRFATPGFAR